jgi:hypothetical protein
MGLELPISSMPIDSPELHELQEPELHELQAQPELHDWHSWQCDRLKRWKQPKPDSPHPPHPPQLLHPAAPPTANAKTSRDNSFFILGISITNGIRGRRGFWPSNSTPRATMCKRNASIFSSPRLPVRNIVVLISCYTFVAIGGDSSETERKEQTAGLAVW